MNKQLIIKTTVFLLSALIIFGTVTVTPISAQTETPDYNNAVYLNDGFTIPDTEDFTDPQNNFSDSIPYIEQRYDNSVKNGVSLNYNGGSYDRAVFTSGKYNIDGFYFKADGINKKDVTSDDPQFCVLASDNTSAGRFILLFDTGKGSVSYFNSANQAVALLSDNTLKYAALSHSLFTIGFKAKENGTLVLEISFGGNTALSADIPTEYSEEVGKNADSSYMGISSYCETGYTAVGFTINIVGIKSDEYTRPTSSTFIKQVADGKNTLTNGNYACFPNGMVSEFTGTDIGSRHVSAQSYPVDGLRLRFDKLKKTEGYSDVNLEFAVTFTQNADSIGAVRIALNTDMKTLGYYTLGSEPVTIISDEELGYDNISGKEFVIGFDIDQDRNCIVSATVGDASALYGTIPASFFLLMGGAQTAHFTVSPANSINYFSVKTTGVYVEKHEDGFHVPDKWDFKNVTGITDNVPKKATVFNGWETKGTRLTFCGGDVGRRITTEEKYNFDGLSLRFDNLKRNSQAQGALRFTVLASEQTEVLGGFRVMADTEEGTLSYYNASTDPVVFLSDDLLKYENLSQTEFIMSFNSTSDGSMKCSIKTDSGELIYGFIPADFCNIYAKNIYSSYIMFAPGKAIDGAQYYFSVDIIGIKSDSYTVPSGSVMRKIVGSGNTLTAQKNGVFAVGETSGFTKAQTISRQCSREKYDIDGLSLRFNGFVKTDETYPVMAVRLTDDINAASGTTLYIDSSSGTLCLNGQENILLTSDILQYKRLCGREFILSFELSDNSSLTVTVQVSGYAPISAVMTVDLPDESLYFAVAPGYGTYSFSVTLTGVLNKERYIDNSWLLPQYKCDGLVNTDKNGTPEWLSSAIIGEANVSVFGTFYDMLPLLDHCAETGINALWLTPINDRGVNGNGYSNMGINTIDPYLTGILSYDEEWRQLTDTEYEKGWEVFAEFIAEAHKRNIRILFDAVSFGALKESPLITEHPEWFKSYSQEVTCRDFDWSNSELAEYYVESLTEIAQKTGIDGLRFDSEPQTAGYEIDGRIRQSILTSGRKLIYIAETKNNDNTVYDLSEGDVQGPDYISVKHFESLFLKNNIVDSVKSGDWIGAPEAQDIHKSGEFRYYTFQLCCHDSYEYGARGNRLVMGYEALFSPFIPVWVIGEEMNNNKDGDYTRILYLNTFKRSDLREPEKRAYYEDVKKMIEIRRKYSDIFEVFPDNHKNSNICKADVEGENGLQAYARYSGNRGAVIVPNNTDEPIVLTVKPRLFEMGISGYEIYTVVDLNNGRTVTEGTEKQICSFEVSVNSQDTGRYLIVGGGEQGEAVSKPVADEPDDNSDLIEYTQKTPEYFIPDIDDLTDFGSFWTENVPEAENIEENGIHKGVRLTYNGGDVGRRITTSEKYNADGLSLKFKELTRSLGCVGDPNITVMLSRNAELDKFRIMINTNDGTLSYYNGTVAPVIIAESDKLKYSALSESSFTVTFNINTEGSVLCTVNVSDNYIISGTIPDSFACLMGTFGSTPLYAAVGPGRADTSCVYNFSLDFVGIWQDTSTAPQRTLVSKVNSNAASSFEETDKGGCHEGVKFNFNGCNIGGCMMYSTSCVLNGLKLSFERLNKNVGYEDNLLKFSICIGDSADTLPRFRIVFDTMSGTISYYSGDNPYGSLTTVASDNILKYKNLSGHPFEILLRSEDDGNINISLTLGSKTVSGIIPKEFYRMYVKNENIYFGISSSNRNGYFSLVLSGIEQINTVSFPETWFSKKQISVPNGCAYRLPVPDNKAGHVFIGWRDQDNNNLAPGTRLISSGSVKYEVNAAYPGDVDCNGKKESADLVLLRKYTVGVIKDVSATADSNCDSIIDIRDLRRLKKMLSE